MYIHLIMAVFMIDYKIIKYYTRASEGSWKTWRIAPQE